MEFTDKQLEAMTSLADIEGAAAQRLAVVDQVTTKFKAFVVTKGARRGSIGFTRHVGSRITPYSQHTSVDWRPAGVRVFSGSVVLTVEAEGREPLTLYLDSDMVSWLEDYEGPAVWRFTRKSKADETPIFDKTGEEVFVGDVVIASFLQDRLIYGKIERRSAKGTIWVRELPSRVNDQLLRQQPVQLTTIDSQALFKVAGLADRLMLAKLAS